MSLYYRYIAVMIIGCFAIGVYSASATVSLSIQDVITNNEVQPQSDPIVESEDATLVDSEKKERLDVTSLILEHLGDSYEWHIVTIGETHITVPLPIIIRGTNGWELFSSSRFKENGGIYHGFFISAKEPNKGKIVYLDGAGEEIRPLLNISITKNVFSLFISCLLLIGIILGAARWYKKRQDSEEFEAPKGFVGFMEMFIMSVNDDIIMPGVGKDHRRFAPYLLTAFFFIFFNNILGLIPIFPAGANLTGNIAITLVLALATFLAINLFGTKEYWKEILWPDVPVWLKFPIPIMPAIEIIGMLTKPFALMIRLFANILAGHSIILGLICLIFITANMGAVLSGAMTFISVLLTLFINFLEILVAYIQAYVFTMLSAVFIGLSRVESPEKK